MGGDDCLHPYFRSMNNQILNHSILDRYLKIVLGGLDSTVRQSTEYYNFRCNVCGDSQRSKKKKRGYILKRKYPWMFFCHNCGVDMRADKWLKEYHPVQYREYIKEILQQDSRSKQKAIKSANKIHEKIKDEQTKKRKIEKDATKYFVPITSKSKIHKQLLDLAIQFCIGRKIPKSVWLKWYVATEHKYGGRLIIPFFDNSGKIYYFQARTLCGQEPKYLNRMEGRENAIYNIYHIKKSKPVVMLEGPFDSLYLHNSIATCGTSITEEVQKKLDALNVYYLFDFDKDGLKKSKKYLRKHKQVFLWRKYAEDTMLPGREKWDLNDLYLHLNRKNMFDFEELKLYFSNNLFDEIYL